MPFRRERSNLHYSHFSVTKGLRARQCEHSDDDGIEVQSSK